MNACSIFGAVDLLGSWSRFKTSRGRSFFYASDMINGEDWKSEGDDVFWDASDKKNREWQETVRMGYRQQSSENKAPKFFVYAAEERNKRWHRGGENATPKGQVKGKKKRPQFCAR